MAKNTEYEFEETMVTLTDEDGIDKDFYVDEIYEVDGRLYNVCRARWNVRFFLIPHISAISFK